jgi:cytochrome c556
MSSRLALAVLACSTLLAAVPASAQFQKPEDAIKYRQATFTVMASHFGRLGAMVQGKVPFDAKVAQENADLVATLSLLPFKAFGPNTDLGETDAKPEVWSQADKFQAAGKTLQENAAKLNAAAKTGDLAQIKAAFGATGKSCKACHDNYRKE